MSASRHDTHQELRERLLAQEATVGVVGLGYVGLPLAHALVRGGSRVLGFDVDPAKIEMLARGECYLEHIGAARTRDLTDDEKFSATADFSRLNEPDVLIVCVPTPIGPHQEPDLRFVTDVGARIGARLRKGQLIILESTTYPGTTRREFLGAIRDADAGQLRVGEDFFVAYSPEREDPGRNTHTTSSIPKLVGGLDETSTELAVLVYAPGLEQVIPVSSAEVAEAAKLLENIFRAVNIALVNELKMILTSLDIDIWEVVAAASTKPFGFMPFYPGPGLGGHCIPIDPFYLTWRAKEAGHSTRFIELAGTINTSMPSWVVQRALLALNEAGKAMRGARVLVAGLAYKPDVDDTRESPSFEMIEELRELGAVVHYTDPHVPVSPSVRRHDLQLSSQPVEPDVIASYDLVLIATDHSDIDWSVIAEHARLTVDTRNVLTRLGLEVRGRLVKA